jgi:hypothetical protein
LIVWQKAHYFVLEVYRMTETFPQKEIYGLTSQFRRAAISIAANIADGSLQECSYYLILAKDLGYAEVSPLFIKTVDEIGKMINVYSQRLQIPKF